MYEYLNGLSDPCVQSIDEMYQLREDYWRESEAPPPHGAGGFFFLLICIVGFMAVRRCMWNKKAKKVRNLMAVLHANPALKKANVEGLGGASDVRTEGRRASYRGD